MRRSGRGRKKAELNEAERHEVKRTATSSQESPWKPPPTDWVKCNSDGAWNKDRETSGLGWICRDKNGMLLWAGARAVTKAGSPLLAEAEALKWGVECLANFDYKNVIFESDSVSLVSMINGTDDPWAILLPIIEVIRQLLMQVGSFEVRYHARGGNKAADRIAKESITFVSSIPKLYSIVPLWLKYQVGSDQNSVSNILGE